MEFFLPSLLILLLAAIIVFLVFPNMTPFLLALAAAASLVIAVQNHYSIFSIEYSGMTWTTSAKNAAPHVLVAGVILASLGYLIYIFTSAGGNGNSGQIRAPNATIPPPASATNFITNAIGNGLEAVGLANVQQPNRSLVSVSPSLKKNISNSELRNILASRAKVAV